MSRVKWSCAAGCLAALTVAAGGTATSWADEEQPQPRQQFRIRVLDERGLGNERGFGQFAGGRYWVGLHCTPVSPALRAQLGLPENAGLLVEDVSPDSPAAKAGLKRFDVLVRAGDKPLAAVPQLIEAVQAAGGKKLALECIRGGKPQTMEVTPAERPRGEFPLEFPRDREEVEKWMKRFGPRADGEDFRFRAIRPGVVIDRGKPAELPKGLTVIITRKGDGPAEIVVKKDGKSWTATEDKLGELPEDIRPHVQRMLGRGNPLFRGWDFRVQPPNRQPVPAPRGPDQQQLQRQLEESIKKLEQLRQSFDELRRQLPKKPVDGKTA